MWLLVCMLKPRVQSLDPQSEQASPQTPQLILCFPSLPPLIMVLKVDDMTEKLALEEQNKVQGKIENWVIP